MGPGRIEVSGARTRARRARASLAQPTAEGNKLGGPLGGGGKGGEGARFLLRDLFYSLYFIGGFLLLRRGAEVSRRGVENTKEKGCESKAAAPNPLRTFHGAVVGSGCQQQRSGGCWRGGSPSPVLGGKERRVPCDDRMRVTA